MSTFEEKLVTQVCTLANTTRGALKPEAASFIKRRTSKWMKERRMEQSEIEKAAKDLARRYPTSISGTTSVAMPIRSASALASTSHQHAAGQGRPSGKSKTPIPKSTGFNLHNRRSTTTQDNAEVLPKTEAAPPKEVSGGSAPPAAGQQQNDSSVRFTAKNAPTRPAVVKRVMNMASNQKWQSAIQQQVEQYEKEEREKKERLRKTREQMRGDMAEAERYRLLREQEKKKEREENSRMVYTVMKDVEEEEKLKVVARREKELRERADMEEQRLDKMKREQDRKVRQKQENARIRAEIAEDIALYEEEERDHQPAVRESIKRFLEDSTKVQEQRKLIEEEKRRRAAEESKGDDSAKKTSMLGAKQVEAQKELVKRRQQLQNHVGKIYSQLEDQRHVERLQQERRTETAMAIRDQEVEKRNEVDKAKKEQMRAKLVASLDEELRIHRARKIQEEHSKLAVRDYVDNDTAKFFEEQKREQQRHRSKQHQLCNQLDNQIDHKYDQMMKPIQIKITERDPPVL